MKRISIILFTFLFNHFAIAETCFTTFEKDSAEADAIFVGKLIDINYGAYWLGDRPVSIYTFEIVESFKGISKYQNITSIMSPVYGCCSPHFKLDSTFLVFAFSFSDNSRIYWTHDCTLTGLLTETKEFYNRLCESIQPTVGGKDLELFQEHKTRLMTEEQKKMDSINLINSNLQSDLANERQKNNYLTIGLIVLGLLTALIFFLKVRRKSI